MEFRPGVNLLAGAHNVPVNNLDSTVAGRDVVSNVFNIGSVQVTGGRASSSGYGQPLLNGLLGGPSSSAPPPQRRGILRGISRILSRRRAHPENVVIPNFPTADPASNARSASSQSSTTASSSGESTSDNVSLTSLEEVEPHPQGWKRITTPEIYVCTMLGTGQGLPCWNPRPRKPHAGERGVIPGDVGTYSAEGGFRKMFNLWDDEHAILRTSRLEHSPVPYWTPPREVIIEQDSLRQGHTLVHGPSAKTIYREGDGDRDEAPIASFQFRYHSHPGAVLALPSPADKEELSNYSNLKRHIIDHALVLYRHANSIWELDDEPLYIITGCIKSEECGIAAYRDPMVPPDDVFKLEALSTSRKHSGKAGVFWAWTDRGTADAQFHSSATSGVKDQSLFLRGFKLAVSPKIRASSRRANVAGGGGQTGGEPSGGPGNVPPWPGRSGGAWPGQGNLGSGVSGSFGGQGSHGFEGERDAQGGYNACESAEFSVSVFPDASSLNSCHPSDLMNEILLITTNADFALTHDDEWRFAFQGVSFWEDTGAQWQSTPEGASDADLRGLADIIVESGVAQVENSLTVMDKSHRLSNSAAAGVGGQRRTVQRSMFHRLLDPMDCEDDPLGNEEYPSGKGSNTAIWKVPPRRPENPKLHLGNNSPGGPGSTIDWTSLMGGPLQPAEPSEAESICTRGACWTCKARQKRCDRIREGDSCKTCRRLQIKCFGWGSQRPDWMKDETKVAAYRVSINEQLIRTGVLSSGMHTPPKQEYGEADV